MTAFINDSVLPWVGTSDEERRFERILMSVLVPMLVLAIAIPLLPLFKLAMEKIEEPPVPVKLLVPPPRRIIPPPASAPAPKPEPAPAEAKTQEKPAPAPKPVTSPEAARDRAARRLAAAARELSSLRETPVITSADSKLSSAVAADKSASADLSALQASRNSGGISTSGIGTTGSGTSLAEHATGGTGAGSTGVGSTGGGNTGRAGSYQPQRSKESIQIVFDRNKAAFDALYQRALRQDGNLRGVLTLEITILPSGKVSGCRVLASELHDPDLESKVVSRVQLLDFGREDVPTVNATFPLRFFPS